MEESNLVVEVVGLTGSAGRVTGRAVGVTGFCAGASFGLGGAVGFWGSVASDMRGVKISIVKCPSRGSGRGSSGAACRSWG